MPAPSRPASTRASATTGVSSSTWARLAISGTTPPKRAWRSTWLDTTEDSTAAPLATTAAAVSSHEVSIPRMQLRPLSSLIVRCLERGRSRHLELEPVEPHRVVVGVDLVGPPHEGVLVALDVVVLAHARRPAAELPVHRLRAAVAPAHSAREVAGPGAVARVGGGGE